MTAPEGTYLEIGNINVGWKAVVAMTFLLPIAVLAVTSFSVTAPV